MSFYSMADTTQVGTGRTVLVVDDHATTRQTIARMLEAGGFSVEQASSGSEALEQLARNSGAIDMVLSDVTMPGMSGIDLSYQIRELYPSIPVAIVSGDVSDLERSIIGRAEVPFIKKPFHAESLFSAVKEAIQTHGKD